MTADQIDALVADLALAIVACDPKDRLWYGVMNDDVGLLKHLTRLTRTLDLPAPGPLLPPETMPWREVRESLAWALSDFAGTHVRRIDGTDCVRRAIALATGSAS